MQNLASNSKAVRQSAASLFVRESSRFFQGANRSVNSNERPREKREKKKEERKRKEERGVSHTPGTISTESERIGVEPLNIESRIGPKQTLR